ncbi:hypothetical protein EJ065_5622 [Corallococcus coralloides]|uniref:Uncharacterized protein n=1 Tax=Corallococcus coralloides TaxID=184914 RepID=A0A410RYX5_CORCK|nr:hypothetical protein EJ065_5622 [Corallococcus coralloides]
MTRRQARKTQAWQREAAAVKHLLELFGGEPGGVLD